MKKLVVTLLMLPVSFIGSAITVSTAVVITDKSLQIITDPYWPRVYINGVVLDATALGCEHSIPVISLGKDNPQGELMYNTLLSAKKSGQTVLLTAKECWGGYSTPLIFSISTY